MFKRVHPLLTCLLASTLLLVQSAAPWMHVGCLHDHSSHAEAAHAHSGCSHHHHHDAAEQEGLVRVEHSHAGGPHDCPACRFLLLTSHVEAQSDQLACESLVERQPLAAPIAAASERIGIHFSRGPPQRS